MGNLSTELFAWPRRLTLLLVAAAVLWLSVAASVRGGNPLPRLADQTIAPAPAQGRPATEVRPVTAGRFIGKDGTVFTRDSGTAAPRTRNVARASHAAAGVPSVAIVAAAANDALAPWFLDPQSKLVASGAFASVTVINANAVTPSVAELSGFDAVLVWSNLGFVDATLLGDNLAQYVDNGGGVVLATFANSSPDAVDTPGGRWENAQYEIIMPHSGTTTGVASLGTIMQPGHPIMSGVGLFGGGSSSFRPTTTSLYPSGQLIASWSDGSTLVAVREDTVGARVDLGFYPPSDAVLPDFWDATTDGDLLLVNALLYAANRVPLVPGDSDGDGDRDINDYNVFDACFTGPGVTPALAGCVTFDFDRDNDIDCSDWFAFGDLFSDTQRLPVPAGCRAIIPTVSEWGLACMTLVLLTAGTMLIRRCSGGGA